MMSPCSKLDGAFPSPLLYTKVTLIFHRYANRAARFVNVYDQGLSGAQAAWANRKYHSHRTLPPDIIKEVKLSLAT